MTYTHTHTHKRHLCAVKNMLVTVQDYFNGDDDGGIISPVAVVLGVSLVPAGLSQFCKVSLNPVQ